MKFRNQRTMKSGAKGIRVLVSGRLGVPRLRSEVQRNVPLHTLRADIDYGLRSRTLLTERLVLGWIQPARF